MTAPACFISYSWDNDSHKEWIRKLASELQENGVNVILDQWDTYPGIDLPQFMETAIRESDYVLLICTPTFAIKANSNLGGVGYEKMIVTGEIFGLINSPKKFVPILRTGTPQESLPSYLRSKLFIDFSKDNKYQESLKELIHHLFQVPPYKKPPLGKKPSLVSQTSHPQHEQSLLEQQARNIFCQYCGSKTGTKTTCVGTRYSHNFQPYSADVFCKYH